MTVSYQSASDLIGLLGEEAYLKLCEEFGGTRVYVPARLPDDHELIGAIGEEATRKLVDMYAPSAIRVPLARRERAHKYRAQGFSHARIARKLGITETGVEKLLRRECGLPESASQCRNTAQLRLL